MSILHDIDAPALSYWHRQAYVAGTKAAADANALPGQPLGGLLYAGACGGKPAIMLSVPNALVRGAFDALTEPGVELPLDDKKLNAHVRVILPSEVEMLGGVDAIKNDRGKPFRYSLGRLVDFEPSDWPGVAHCWALRVHSPDLQRLRRSLGLSSLPPDDQHAFHIVVATRKRGVLGRNEKAKDTTPA